MKILITKRHGWGWSSGIYDNAALSQYVATHKPTIEAVEAREKEFDEDETSSFSDSYYADVLAPDSKAMDKLFFDIWVVFGQDVLTKNKPYLEMSCKNLTIEEIFGPVVVNNFDGCESVDHIPIPRGVVIIPKD